MKISTTSRRGGHGARTRAVTALVAVAAASAMALAGCSSNGGDGTPSGGASGGASGSSACPSGPITLHEIDYYGEPSDTNYTGTNTQKFFDTFSQDNPCVDVVREAPVTSGGGANYKTVVLNKFSAGEQPDILMLDNPDMAQFAAQGLLASLDDLGGIDTGSINKANIQAGTFDGKLYALQLQTNSVAIFYNKKLLADAGITDLPTTWDEFRADAKKASQLDGVDGFVFSGQAGPGQAAWQFYPWAWSNGATTPTIGGAEGTAALDFLTGMVADGSVPKDVANWSQDEPFQAFQAGTAAFCENGTWRIPTLQQENKDLDWGVMAFPTKTAGQTVVVPFGGEVWVIPKTTPEREAAAIEVLRAMAEPDNIKPWAEGLGVVPTVPELWDQAPWNDAAYQVFVDELKNGRGRTDGLAHPENYPDIDQAIGVAIESAIVGQQSAADAMTQAQQTIDPLL